MTNTRRASGGPLRQERYASSEVYDNGLLCNLVNKRCRVLPFARDRALIFFLQQCFHRSGGLRKVAQDIYRMFPEHVGTPSMHRYGNGPEGIYDAEQVKEVRSEINILKFPLKGEVPSLDDYDPLDTFGHSRASYLSEEEMLRNLDLSDHYPTSYPVSAFLDECKCHVAELEAYLQRLCLDPQIVLPGNDLSYDDIDPEFYEFYPRLEKVGFHYIKDLVTVLHKYRDWHLAQAEQAIAQTEITSRIHGDLDFMLHSRSMVVIEGETRTGKTTSAENWVQRHSGQAVFVKLESGYDDGSFFRSIAKAIGTASSGQMKAAELRARIEDTLQDGHLVIVFDEAHFLWPQTSRFRKAPGRIDWVRTALVDHGVPVALVSTPQFANSCEVLEKNTGWKSAQIKGRVKLHTSLPDTLSKADLEAISKHMMPQADKASILRLVGFAQFSDDYVAGIERIVTRAEYFAMRRGDQEAAAEDVKAAIDEVIPASPKKPQKPDSKRTRKSKPATTRKPSGSASSDRLQEPFNRTFSHDKTRQSSDRLRPSESLVNSVESDADSYEMAPD